MERNIGERQRWAWLAAGLSAAAASKICGYDWLWVLIGGLLVTIYYMVVDRVLEPQGMAALLCQTFGRGGKILAALTLLWTILVMGWAANLADTAFPMVQGFPGLGWVLLALAAWGSRKGAAACARCSGVLCLFLIALYGVLVAFAVPDVTWSYLKPSTNWSHGLWSLGICLLPAGVWYVPCTRSRKGPAWQMALLLPLFAAALAAVTAGVLSPELAAVRNVPLYDLAQSVSLFGVVERIEPLLSAAMTMGVFALLSSMTCSAQALVSQIRECRWSGIGISVTAGGLMVLTKDLPIELLSVGSTVFWLIIPALMMALARKRH
ncbi:MAG: hypothetical protein J6J51_06570 [Clostridia bacterium]|nr:hypothetical protein [Clostridia bacterium]